MIDANHYFDAKEFARQAAKPQVLTLITTGSVGVAIFPPLVTARERAHLEQAALRTQRLSVNCGKGQRS